MTNKLDNRRGMKVAALHRVCAPYRVNLFKQLSARPEIQLRLFIGDNVPNSKTRNAKDLAGLDVFRLPTRFYRLGSRVLVMHRELLSHLTEFEPDVLLCEGESNLLSLLQALYYCRRHQSTALVHWSLGGLPGEPAVRKGLRGRLVNRIRSQADAFVTYSSYGRDVLIQNGFC